MTLLYTDSILVCLIINMGWMCTKICLTFDGIMSWSSEGIKRLAYENILKILSNNITIYKNSLQINVIY